GTTALWPCTSASVGSQMSSPARPRLSSAILGPSARRPAQLWKTAMPRPRRLNISGRCLPLVLF
ncbi:hypothetical protein LPJ77_001501, partial [Coemansia sp. RSA 2523]